MSAKFEKEFKLACAKVQAEGLPDSTLNMLLSPEFKAQHGVPVDSEPDEIEVILRAEMDRRVRDGFVITDDWKRIKKCNV